MKRLATLAGLAFASLIGAFAFTAPAHAAVACSSPTVSGGAYPQGYLWICQDPGDTALTASEKNSAINALAALGNTAVNVSSDAKTKMSTANQYVYLFKNYTRFNNYCNQVGNPTPTPACNTGASGLLGFTYATGSTWQSLVFRDPIVGPPAQPNATIGETTAHEAGHQLDLLYGQSLYLGGRASDRGRDFDFKLSGMKVLIGGTAVAGHQVQLTFEGYRVSPAVTISYTVMAGDTLQTISNQLVSLINANGSLSNTGVHARASNSGTTTITVLSDGQLKYGNAVVGTGPLIEVLTQGSYDWDHVIKRTPACAENTGVFSKEIAANSHYICGQLQKVTIGGTMHSGDVLRVAITDAAIPGTVNVDYTVPAGSPTIAIVAAGVAAQVNATSSVTSKGITAFYQGSGSDFRLSSQTNATTYVVSRLSGTTTTITKNGAIVNGGADTLSTEFNYNYNDMPMKAAWAYYFTPYQWYNLAGTPTNGDDITTTFFSSVIGTPTIVTYHITTVGQTLGQVAMGIATQFNANTTLSGAGITAKGFSDGSVIISGLGITDSYELSTTGNTTASPTNPLGELYAELTAITAGQGTSGNQSQDDFLAKNVGNFPCSQTFVERTQKTGALPVPGDYSTNCK